MLSNSCSDMVGVNVPTAKSSVPSRRRGSATALKPSNISNCTPGMRSRKCCTALVRKVSMIHGVTAMDSRPVISPRNSASCVLARSIWPTTNRACSRSIRPVSVKSIPRAVRITSGSWAIASSSRNDLVTAAWDRSNRRAAARMLPVSATATKACR
ncbi:hypothetical protein D3C76_1215260 [compost metagenome]